MTMINPEKLADTCKEILILADRLEQIAKQHNTSVVFTSGKREGDPTKSWHNTGRALDFYFLNINVFKLCTEMYYLCSGQIGAFKGVTEFEMVKGYINGQPANHFHIAFGDEGKLETFTSDYSHYQ